MSNRIERKSDTVCIVGFAPSWTQTPWDDDCEIWSLNEAYKLFQNVPNARADRWFEIHSRNSPSKNTPEHITWLQNCTIPLYMWEHYEDMPNSIPFPKEEIIKRFGNYFTNSISWMIALAIYEGFKEIKIFGIDMAQDSEYQWQRPSCEYFLGIAKGLGIKVYIPQDSDLLKTGQLYGFETDNSLRIKMKARVKELKERVKHYNQEKAKAQQTIANCDAALHQITGAIEDCNYWLKNWVS